MFRLISYGAQDYYLTDCIQVLCLKTHKKSLITANKYANPININKILHCITTIKNKNPMYVDKDIIFYTIINSKIDICYPAQYIIDEYKEFKIKEYKYIHILMIINRLDLIKDIHEVIKKYVGIDEFIKESGYYYHQF